MAPVNSEIPADSDSSTRAHHRCDISSHAFWARPFAERERVFAELRREPAPTWHRPFQAPHPHDEPGFWALTRHADIAQVSQNHQIFVSSQGVGIGPMPLKLQRKMSFFLTMDPPRHTVFRRLIAAAFTPKQIRRIEDVIAANAKEVVDGIVGAGDFDFVERVSALLPMRTVSDMIGVPPSERDAVTKAAGHIIADDTKFGNAEEAVKFLFENIDYLHAVGADLAAHRRKHPADDLMTSIVEAEIDGDRLTDEQIGSFMILLSTAGNDTTKQTTSHTMKALIDHPDQRAWLLADFDDRIGGAVEEFVRYATPVLGFARTAAADTRIGGREIAKGEKVALFYCSANRDETVFQDPARFDLARQPNPHQGFGGGGVHFCLGRQVAKTQLRSIFRELLTRVPGIELGEPVYLASNFVHGVKHLPAHV
jgi:cytochrome P450